MAYFTRSDHVNYIVKEKMPCLSVYKKTSMKVPWCFLPVQRLLRIWVFSHPMFIGLIFFFNIIFVTYRELSNTKALCCWNVNFTLHVTETCVCVWAVYEPSIYTIMLQNYFYRSSKTVCLLDCGELQRSLQSLCCEWHPLQSWEPQKRLENPCETVSNFAYIWSEKWNNDSTGFI